MKGSELLLVEEFINEVALRISRLCSEFENKASGGATMLNLWRDATPKLFYATNYKLGLSKTCVCLFILISILKKII
jgi:hypothetical protein